MTQSSFQTNRKDIIFILVILSLALAVRFIYLRDYKRTAVYPLLSFSDGDYYYSWARDIASGDLWGSQVFMKWPLYAYVLAFLFKISNNSILLVYLFQFLLGAFNCVLIYLIARLLFNEVIGFIAALLCIWYGLFVFYDGLLAYNSLSLFFNSLLFLFLLQLQNHAELSNKSLFSSGVFLGLCTLTQANIIIFGILAAVWILYQKKSSLIKLFFNFFSFLLGVSIIIGAVTFRNYLVAKDPVLISGNVGITFYSGNNPHSDGTFRPPTYMTRYLYGMNRDAKIIAQATLNRSLKISEVSGFWMERSLAFIKSKPKSFLKLLFTKFTYLFSPKEFILDPEYFFIADKIKIFKIMFLDLNFILPFVILGIILHIRKIKETMLLYLALATLSLSIILFFVASRYRITVLPFLFIFAACGVFSLWEKLKKKNYGNFALLFLAALSIFISFNLPKVFPKNIAQELGRSSVNFRDYLAKANYYSINLDYMNAIEEAKLAYDLEPKNPEVVFTLANLYYRMNELKMAEEKFQEVLKISPLVVDAYYNLGILYNQQRRFSEAKEALEKAVWLDPGDFTAHFELGKTYQALKQPEQAKEELKLALEYINRWRSEEIGLIKNRLADLEK